MVSIGPAGPAGPTVRLSFVLGSWQVVALAAGLAQADAEAAAAAPSDRGARPVDDLLVLYETGPVSDALKAAMRDIAGAVRPWRAVVEAWATMASIDRRMSRREFDAARASLRTIVGTDRVDEIWLCRATRAAERLVLDTWPGARVMLYEDGVLSYLSTLPSAAEGDGLLGRIADAIEQALPARRLRRWKDGYDPRQLPRIGGAWMLLGDTFGPPPPLAGVPWHAVPDAVLRRVVEGCRAIPAVAAFRPAPTERPAVLVLGQALSRFHAIARDEELRVYADAVGAVVERGYDVWWKEHPRAVEPFFAELAARSAPGRVRELAVPFAWPVELVADRLGLAAVVGGITTALFYLPRLLGIPAFTVAPALVPSLRGNWALQNRLFVERIAPLAALPSANLT